MFLLKNTYTKKEYIVDTLWYAFALFCAFCSLCFISLPSLSVAASKCILFALTLGVTSICTALSFKRGRNSVSLWTNSLIPLEIYAVMAYMPYLKSEILFLLASIAVISVIFICTMLSCKDLKLGTRIKVSGAGVRVIAAFCMLILLLPIGIKSVLGHGFLIDRTEIVNGCSDASEWTADNKTETLMLLKEESWKTLAIKEKMEVLATIKNIEIHHLGIDHEIYLEADELEEGVIGVYEPRSRKLLIDIRHLESSNVAECLDTVLHECYHAYQHMIAEFYVSLPDNYKNLRLFAAAKDYAKELSDYNDGTKDIGAYYRQRLENDAREYASGAAKAYCERIGEGSI